MIRLRFGLGALRSAPGLAASLVLLSAMSSFCLLSLGLCLSAYQEATAASTQTHFGRYHEQVTAAFPEAERSLREMVEQGRAVGIATAQSVVRDADDRGAEAQARLSSGPADLGALTSGAYPRQPGEATVSSALAGALGASLGDTVTLTPQGSEFAPLSLRITGLTTNPADTAEMLIDAVAPRDVATAHEEAVAWLVSSDVENEPFFTQASATGAIRAGTEDLASRGLLEEAQAADLGRLSVLHRVLAAIVVSGTAALGLAYLHRHAAGLRAYRASGGSTAAGILWLGLPALALSSAGIAGGMAASLLAFRRWSPEIGRWWNQRWEPPHPGPALGFVLLCLVGGLIALGAILLLRARRPRDHTHHPHPLSFRARIAWLAVGLAALGLCGFFLYLRWGLVLLSGHRYALGCAAMSAGALALGLRWSRSELRYRARLPRPALAFFSTAILTGMVGHAALTSAAAGVHISHIKNAIPGAEGYLAASHMDSNKVGMLTERFPEIMSTALVFLDPIAPGRPEDYPRATNGKGAECLPRHAGEPIEGPLCGDAPLGLLGLAASPRAAELINHAGEQYVTSGGGGLVFFRSTTGTLEGATAIPGLTGAPLLDSDLTPNIVLGLDSPEARALGLVPSALARVIIPEFSSFSPDQQREFKAVLIGQASYSNLAQAHGPQVQALRTEQITHPLAASGIALVALAALVVLRRQQQRPLRRVFSDSHAGGYPVVALLFPTVGPWALALVTGSLAGALGTQDAAFLRDPGGILAPGLWWAAPIAAAALGCLAAGVATLLSKSDSLP
ncbi:hypothetical protein MHT86_08825 [Corynebacterium mastitidis]|uniref:ABC transporter permease n=1 Tax=Corynebacterium mastitidis TaxID=161890 RepID=A0A2N0X797_9CORY|nr:hypothetical protein [Corynebacterium mastitidis]MCH6197596.1 hypothetical protein [Corynebacterium mastitidis]PKF68563.1 hypothetical protein CXB45_06625 [Corynebacterium mastitidis]